MKLFKKFIGNNEVDETKILLANDQALKSRNAADNANIDVIKVNASDEVVITNLAEPSTDSDAATKGYVDANAGGSGGLSGPTLVKVTIPSGNASVNSFPVPTIDGVGLSNGDLILLRTQSASAENGVWIYNGVGNALTRAPNWNGALTSGQQVFVTQGTTQANKTFILTTTVATLGTDPVTFIQSSFVQDQIRGNVLPASGVTNVALGSSSQRFSEVNSTTFVTGASPNQLQLAQRPINALTPNTAQGMAVLSFAAQPLYVMGMNDTSANATATQPLEILTGNKTAGTGNSGNIILRTGTSAGGNRGKVTVDARMLKFPVASADPASPEAGDCYYNTTSNVLKLYDGTTWQVLAFAP